MSSRPIADYGMLSDCHSAALVGRDGTIEWLCLPRFDSPSVFGSLLDEEAGHWVFRPRGITELSRRYRGRSLVLETYFTTTTGRCVLVDAMALGPGERDHDIGRRSPHVLLRELTCLEGEVDVEVELVPRPDYGREVPRPRPLAAGAEFPFSTGRLVFSSSCALEEHGATLRSTTRLHTGDACRLALTYMSRGDGRPIGLSPLEVGRAIEDTTEGWRSWSALHQNYAGPWSELVYRSGCVMQGLTYRRTGAMVAAPTTSLPEEIGGIRNWDYRFSWLRDSSMTLQALWVAACPDEAGEYFRWIAATTARDAAQKLEPQILYGIGGERELAEQELTHLKGWRDSRPVRIGNGAARQRQIDVYGEVLDAAYRLLPTVEILTPDTTRFLTGLADTAATLWTEPDQGIWEVRGPPKHFLYSKLMCWVAVDRVIAMADRLGALDRVPAWSKTRADIRQAIEQRGWNAAANSFTQYFGGDELDASSLMLLITGFLPPEDPRIKATIRAVETRLLDGRGLVLRYRPLDGAADGLSGGEGSFLLCTYWLAQSLALSGQTARAREVFERATSFANDLGLLSEEVDAVSGELLGNFPQALSHIGLVNAAWAIAEAEQRSADYMNR